MMNRLFTLLIILFISTPLFSQVTIHRDPEIAGMVAEVSSDSLRSYITDLVSFGTRHLLSTQSDSKKGIGAASTYVLRRFNQFAQASGGRMTCFIDTTTLPADGKRVNRPVLLGNVMAVLKGTNPADKRVFII
ncbi:MAG TPA: peptidase M28, partial [Ginsengibacter sp.]|nr:peptidase M28 [Ginsengibacter sp.]